jgi:hypothetical protein
LGVLPFWRGEENGYERFSEIKGIVKKAMGQWLFVPDITNIEDSVDNGRVNKVGGLPIPN